MMGITLFCEDARDEAGGAVSLMGILSDNIGVAALPSIMPKLVIYTRLNFDLDDPASPVELSTFRGPNGEVIANAPIPAEVIAKAIKDARAEGNKVAGVFNRIEGVNFPATEGKFYAIVRYQDTEYTTGSMAFSVQGQPN